MTREIPLTRGLVALVDDEDYEWLSRWNWHAMTNGYAARKRKNFVVLMHRIVADAVPGFVVDHINGDPLDNRSRNLRICTQAENTRNHGPRCDNKAGVRGVSLHDSGLWRARIQVAGRDTHIGYFKTLDAASAAYDGAVKEHHGEFGKTNAEWAQDTGRRLRR